MAYKWYCEVKGQEDKKMIKQVSIIVLTTFLFVPLVNAKDFSDAQIVSAIYKAEGGMHAQYPYGIRSIKCNGDGCRKICLNTVKNNRKRFARYGYKQYSDFIEFLGSRYCPTSGKLSKAELRLNGNWVKNVKFYLNKQ